MDRYAVLGHPIAHSLSPRIHRMFAAQVGHALEYETLDIEPDNFADRLNALLDDPEFQGANVTLPFKANAKAAAHRLTPEAMRAGAVNTLIREGQTWLGANTDGVGLMADLARLEVVFRVFAFCFWARVAPLEAFLGR